MLLHPEDLWCSEACKCNVCGILRKFFLSDNRIKIFRLLTGTAVIPENRRTDHIVIFIQSYKTVHLTAKTDSCYFFAVNPFCELFDSFHALGEPVLRILLRPARMGEEQRIFF